MTCDLPILSPTVQTTHLLTPKHFERITIDQPHYRHYLDRAVQTEPPHRNPILCRMKKAGDRFFFLHRDIPVHQQYTRTPLSLSVNRNWDQGASRPLSSNLILEKELHLPFPAEHPYTSHISRFAVFPDTKPRECLQLTDASTQTPTKHSRAVFTSAPPTPYYVAHKACGLGMRVEQRCENSVSEEMDVKKRVQLWNVPHSQRHRRAHTYPAPALKYAPSASHTGTALSPHTRHGLEAINRSLTWTTTYGKHFTCHPTEASVHGIPHLDLSLCSHRRPFTAESRGKYFQHTSSWDRYCMISEEEEEEEEEEEKLVGTFGAVEMVDKATQTDFVDIDAEPSHQSTTQLNLPSIKAASGDEPSGPAHQQLITLPLPSSNAAGLVPSSNAAGLVNQFPPGAADNRSPSATERPTNRLSTPQSATCSSARSGDEQCRGLSKSETLRRFHSQYPEQAPDLRDYSISEGKRHIIHGHHAYYFH